MHACRSTLEDPTLVDVDAASHSALVDPYLDAMRDALAGLRPRASATAFFSTVDAAWRDGATLDADYWCANLRRSVRFWEASSALLAAGYARFVEAGPHPVLVTPLLQTMRERGGAALAVGTTRRGEPELRAALASLAGLYVHGADPDWARVGPAARCVSLPSFPFQHEPFWFREGAARKDVAPPPRPSARAASPDAHPLLGDAVLLGGSATDRVWSVPLSTARVPYLEDHLVRGSAILPGAAFVELALAAARHTFPDRPFALEDTTFHEYLAVPSLRTTTLQVQLRAVDAHTCAVRFYTFDDAPGRRARLHAESTVRLADDARGARQADPFRSPRALLAEALRVEMARAEANPGHRFAVLSAAQEGPLDAASLDAVSRVLREIVRREDEVFNLAEGRWALLLRGVSASVSRAQVAARLRTLARERLAHLTPVAEVRLQLVDAGLDAHRLADDLTAGRTGGARPGVTSMPPPVERTSLGPAAFYTAMERRGVSYGPAFRPVLGAEQSAGSTVSRLEVPAGLRGEMGRYSLHPAILDGCFQAAAVPFLAARSDEGEPATFLPVGVGRVVSLRPPSAALTCRAWLRPSDSPDDDTFEVDVVITDDAEHTVAEIDRLRLRRVASRDVPRLQERRDELFHAWRWVEREARPAAAPPAWAVVGDSPLARSLAARAAAPPGGRADVTVVVVDPAARDDLDAASAAPLALARDVSRLRRPSGDAHRVVVVTTEGATPLGGAPSPAHAGVIALCRVVTNERPELTVQSIDLPADPSPADLDRLVEAASREALDDEVAVRGGRSYARQLAQSPPAGDARSLRSPSPGMVTALVSAGDRAAFAEVTPPEAAFDEVDLCVRAAVVAKDGDRAAPVALVGEVARENPIAGLRAGARVVAWVRHLPAAGGVLVASRMAIPPACAVVVPDGVTDLQALAAAALYLEPALAIQRIAAARPGERVLVHEADGARGRAACDIARAAGAIVLASASSFADRDDLRASGVAQALHSRDGDLAAAVIDLTASEGVHVIVLAGREASDDLVTRAASLGARVVRLGRGAAAAPRADARNAVVGEVDVDAIARTRPAAVRQQLRALLDDLAAGALDAGASLPAAAPLADVPQELAGAADPVVVVFEHPRAPVPLPATVGSCLRPDATYLLTGGTGGLGLALAAWLVAHGAKHLCLVSRGAPSAEASAKVDALRRSGATVTCARAAVEDRAALAAVIHDVDASAAPLRGVFHLAGALDDATLDGLTRAHFDAVMRPKLLGASNLHALTRHHPIEHFVLFGSAAAVLGSAAQGNYAAANAAMDAVALARRAEGLPALSVAWGVWGEVGLAARAENRGARLDARGLGVMRPGDALDALGRLLAHGAQGEAGVFAIDWARWTRAYPRAARGSRFAELAPRAEVTARTLDDAPAARRPELAGERVRQMLAEVLRVPAARLAPTQSLAALGLDSLMTVELRARILDALGVDLAPSRILAAATVEALAREVAANVAGAEAHPSPADAVPAADLALPDDLRVTAGDAPPGASDVLLTGATGFVGAHVARALLDDGRATLRCLVRARDEREARDRVLSSLRAYGALRDGDAARIVPVLGDLTLDGMGLSADVRAALARDLDAIVHAGARVNHMFPYARLRDANVRGTAEVLRLAARGRRKAVHHVSTLVVFPLGAGSSEGVGVDEASPLADHAEPFFAGYAASKWAAEHLCLAARARGLDVRIHRPAQVTGSTLAAVSPATDVLWRLVAAALALGVAPELRGGVNLVPVDFVARAIAAVALDPRQANGTFHLMSPTSYPVASALGVLRQMGYPLRAVPAGDWIPIVERSTGATSALAPEVARLRGVDLARLDASPVRCACDATFARLPPELRALATVDDALFARYVRELVARGALPAPPARAPREMPSHPPQA